MDAFEEILLSDDSKQPIQRSLPYLDFVDRTLFTVIISDRLSGPNSAIGVSVRVCLCSFDNFRKK